MTIWEAGIVVGVMLLLLSGYLGMQSDVTDADEARLRAGMIERLHGGVEGYLRSEYAFLERCLDVPSLETEWNGGGASAGGQAGPFKAVRLYPLPAAEAMPSGDHVQALTASLDDLRCDSHEPPVEAYPGVPPSLSEAGFLPAGLSQLSYEVGADTSSNLWRGLDFRLMIRAVNLNRQASDLTAVPPIAARVGLQALLVVQARHGEGMFEGEAGAVLRAMSVAEVGLLRSTGRGTGADGAVAERTIAGTGGGWRMELCDDTGSGVAVSCVDHPVLGGLLGSEVIRIKDDESGWTVRRAFISGAAGGQMVSGSLAAGGSPVARVVTVTIIDRDDALRNVLYRADIGIPEANRMETDIDMGGYGLLNVAYVTGIDIDGDGLVDRGIGLMGPPNVDLGEDDDDPRRKGHRNPVTVYGDLHVRGALHVGTGEEGEVFATDIPAGSVWATGGMQAGADAFDKDLPGASLLAQQGMQVGGADFAMSFDDTETDDESEGSPEGSVWVRGATQVGNVREVIAWDDDEDSSVFFAAYDHHVPAGGLLVGGEIRSSGGMRAVGREIVLAASTSVHPPGGLPGELGRAARNRSWNTVGSGLGNTRDPELEGDPEDPEDPGLETYDPEVGGRLQFRTEEDDLHMVVDSGILKVIPRIVMLGNPREVEHYLGSVGLEADGSARIVVDSTDVWIQDEHVLLEDDDDVSRMKNRTLHDALPRYVSKRFEWAKEYEITKSDDDTAGGRNLEVVVDRSEELIECVDGKRRDVLVPTGWSRKNFGGTAQANVVLFALPPFYVFPFTFSDIFVQTIAVYHYLPFTGWAIHPASDDPSDPGNEGQDAAGVFPTGEPGLEEGAQTNWLYSVEGIWGPDSAWVIDNPKGADRELGTDYRRTIYCDYKTTTP